MANEINILGSDEFIDPPENTAKIAGYGLVGATGVYQAGKFHYALQPHRLQAIHQLPGS